MANTSYWQDKAGEPGAIRFSPIPSSIEQDQILIKVHAWAMNPADHMVQDIALPFVTYPVILGEDVAGTVELVGSAASSKFNTGDRVTGLALGSSVGKPEQEASVFPLCMSTAAHGLFSKDHLGLPFHNVDTAPNNANGSVFIWGGSSGVGCNAIQMCKAAGLEVITTCSASNFDFVKSLGADHVVDYNASDAIDQVVYLIDSGKCLGILHAAGNAVPSCDVSWKSKQTLRVASTNPVPDEIVPKGVDAKMTFFTSGAFGYQETNKATFAEFLPQALARGTYKVAPVPQIVNTKGIEGIQEALNILKAGISAKKLVTLAE